MVQTSRAFLYIRYRLRLLIVAILRYDIASMDFFFKAIKFVIWGLLAIIILPCVFVAGTIYPVWVEWGEDF